MRSLQHGAYDHMIDNIVNSFMGSVQIHHPSYWEEKTLDNSLDTKLLDSLQEIDGLKYASARIETFALLGKGERTKPAVVLGLDPQLERKQIQLDQRLVEGNYFEEGGALLSIDLAAFLKASPGDTIVLFGQGYHGSLASGELKVQGIVDLKTPELNRRTLILDNKSAEEIFNMQGMATTIVLSGEDSWRKTYENTIENLDTNSYSVMNWQQKLPELVQLIKADSAGGLVVLTVLYIIIGFGFLGIIIMLTEERSFEYGVLLAVGMQKSKMMMVFFLETAIMAIIGLIAGLAIAFPVVYYFHYHPINLSGQMQEAVEKFGFEAVIPTSLDVSIPLQQSALVMLLVFCVNLYAIQKIKKLKPVEAMRK
ncbi:ABC transporter permease [bacterium]|nr:ABC transporter permease [bacterium]